VTGRTVWALVAATLAALGLRLLLAGQSLFGDELFTYEIVTRAGLRDMLAGIRDTESTPPAFYVLSWLAAKLGDPTFTSRVPSILLGTATVPAIYALGARTVGRAPALGAAAAFALAPFAVFYGSEARAYATMAFLLVVSTFALLRALDTGRHGWWAAFAVATAGAVLTHYTAGFAVVWQGLWAAWTRPDRRRELGAAYAGVAAAFLGSLPLSPTGVAQTIIGLFNPLTLENVVAAPVRMLFGYPSPVDLDAVPGVPVLVALLLVAALGLAGLVRRPPSREATLLGGLALATPVGMLGYSLVGDDLYVPRNLMASLPTTYLLLAAGVAALPRRVAGVAATVALVAFAVGTAAATRAEHRRPAYEEVGELVESRTGPGTAIVEVEPFPLGGPLREALEIELDRPVLESDLDGAAIRRVAAASPSVIVVVPEFQLADATPDLPFRPGGLRLAERRAFEGQAELTVLRYVRARADMGQILTSWGSTPCQEARVTSACGPTARTPASRRCCSPRAWSTSTPRRSSGRRWDGSSRRRTATSWSI
jgi:hypothetical protein